MPVIAVGSVIPKGKRVLTKRAENVIQERQPRGFVNSFEFHTGFTPSKHGHHTNNPVKVQHFIDSIV